MQDHNSHPKALTDSIISSHTGRDRQRGRRKSSKDIYIYFFES